MLVDDMHEDSTFGYLFLSIKKFKDKNFVAIDPVWFKKNTNLGELTIQKFLKRHGSNYRICGQLHK
jgi:hypothetical protein